MTILVCGDALFDLFAAEDAPSGRLSFDARAGGSPLNVAVGVARLGAPCSLFAGVSTDFLGEKIAAYLASEGVSTTYLVRSGRPTTLSFVGLDASGAPSYAFYASGAADVSLTPADLPALGDDVEALHLGSYTIATPPTADALAALIARERGRFVSLDPNVRLNVEPDRTEWMRRIDALTPDVNLIKVSIEDLEALAPERAPLDVAREWAGRGADLVVVTDGAQPALALRGGVELAASPPPVDIVDTVGAGDAFQAALLAALWRRGALTPGLSELPNDDVAAALDEAARAGAFACGRRGADPPRRAELWP